MSDVTTTNNGSASRSGADPIMSDVQRYLAYFIVGSFVVLLFTWVFRPPNMAPEQMALLTQMCSTLQNILLIAIGFFFGSSKSSQNKDEVFMSKALDPTAAKPGAVVVQPPATVTTGDEGATK